MSRSIGSTRRATQVRFVRVIADVVPVSIVVCESAAGPNTRPKARRGGLWARQGGSGQHSGSNAMADAVTMRLRTFYVHVVVLRITYFEEYYYKLRLMYELRAYAADCTCMGMSRNL